jgi:hypothetical protein
MLKIQFNKSLKEDKKCEELIEILKKNYNLKINSDLKNCKIIYEKKEERKKIKLSPLFYK